MADKKAEKKDESLEELQSDLKEEKEEKGNFQKDGYLIIHDVMYKGKNIPTGERNKLSDLNKDQIKRLLDEKVIEK